MPAAQLIREHLSPCIKEHQICKPPSSSSSSSSAPTKTGYWRADKARMSSVSPEESPVFNCSSLLTTSRDQDSECAPRLGPASWWGWEVRSLWWRGLGLQGGGGTRSLRFSSLQVNVLKVDSLSFMTLTQLSLDKTLNVSHLMVVGFFFCLFKCAKMGRFFYFSTTTPVLVAFYASWLYV